MPPRSKSRSSSSKKKPTTKTRTASESARQTKQLRKKQQEEKEQEERETLRSPSGPSAASSHHLLTWEQVPHFLQFNKFVREGYRPHLSPIEAWKTMYNGFHNETGNIWTHFLPFFVFLYFFLEEMYRVYVVKDDHPPIRTHYVISAIGGMFVCSVSTAYHTLMCSCKNQGEYQNLICIDILGSVVVISTTATGMLIFGNPCFSFFTRAWMISLFSLSTVATIYMIFAKTMSAARRFMLFGGHVLLRLALQFGILMPKYRNTGHFKAMELHSWSFVWLALGGIVNISRVPERFFTKVNPVTGELLHRSGRVAKILDYVGNSHNLWHLLSIYGCYITVLGVAADYEEFHFLDGKVNCGTWK